MGSGAPLNHLRGGTMPGPTLACLRHTLAPLAYRAARVCANAPPGLAEFRVSPLTRPAGAILAQMGDLFAWAAKLAEGKPAWRPPARLPWEQEVQRFFAALSRFDA